MMKTSATATFALAVMVTPAVAEQRYDRRLEAAAIGIVAAKMGSLRGGFAADEIPRFTAPIDRSQPTHLSARRTVPDNARTAAGTRPTGKLNF